MKPPGEYVKPICSSVLDKTWEKVTDHYPHLYPAPEHIDLFIDAVLGYHLESTKRINGPRSVKYRKTMEHTQAALEFLTGENKAKSFVVERANEKEKIKAKTIPVNAFVNSLMSQALDSLTTDHNFAGIVQPPNFREVFKRYYDVPGVISDIHNFHHLEEQSSISLWMLLAPHKCTKIIPQYVDAGRKILGRRVNVATNSGKIKRPEVKYKLEFRHGLELLGELATSSVTIRDLLNKAYIDTDDLRIGQAPFMRKSYGEMGYALMMMYRGNGSIADEDSPIKKII